MSSAADRFATNLQLLRNVCRLTGRELESVPALPESLESFIVRDVCPTADELESIPRHHLEFGIIALRNAVQTALESALELPGCELQIRFTVVSDAEAVAA